MSSLRTYTWDYERTTDPTQEPVAIDQQYLWSELPPESTRAGDEGVAWPDDSMVRAVISGCRQRIENYLDISFITQTWTAYYESPFRSEIVLPRGPLQSVTSVTSYDKDNSGTVFDAASYLQLTGRRSAITLNDGYEWPTDLRARRSMAVVYVTGYGAGSFGSPAFTGSGLDDLSADGTFSSREDIGYRIEIDGTGTPDTFAVSRDGGITYQDRTTEMTGEWQQVGYGLSVKFAATTGHDSGDYWDIACTGHGVPDHYTSAIKEFVSFVLHARLGFTGTDLNEQIESGKLPPGVTALIGRRQIR